MHDIVILAAGQSDAETAAQTGAATRSALPWKGATLADHVHSVCREFADPIVVGGPSRTEWRQTHGGGSFVESIEIGAGLVTTKKFLLVTADLPYLKAESIRNFLADCNDDAGWNWPIIPMEDCRRDHPGLHRTSLKLREGEFTGGNICLIDIQAFQEAKPVIQAAYNARKSPLQLGQIAGLRTLLLIAATKLFPYMVPVSAVESAVGAFLRSGVQAVVTHASDIGTDIDTFAQYQAIIRGSES
ncbi:MAG: nucleotidyltransferase family protein [Armatimonadetes bacterium]|nr:nucleotidyltransferase family protein [Armatimonadota bacterium]MBX3108916.1 nucleotidyltransferase family protein [Fimbriimonadaceae bacterium]